MSKITKSEQQSMLKQGMLELLLNLEKQAGRRLSADEANSALHRFRKEFVRLQAEKKQ